MKKRNGMVAMVDRARGSLGALALRCWLAPFVFLSRAKRDLAEERGQGTTEYAILVGVLVVIAIIAVTAFKGKLQELWSAIADGINGL